MEGWSEGGGGGGFFANDASQSASKSKPATRQQFMYPATVRQVLEAPEEGIKLGENTTSMVTIIGIITEVQQTSTNVTFTVSDDTGVIDCIDWIETDDFGEGKKMESLMENNYYQVFGSIKSPQGKRRIMVFNVTPIEDFNLLTAHMAEVLTVTRMVLKGVPVDDKSAVTSSTNGGMSYNPGTSMGAGAAMGEPKSKLNAQQLEVLNMIKAQSQLNSHVGLDTNDPSVAKKYPAAMLAPIIEYLVGEGFIYSTIDDEHYAST